MATARKPAAFSADSTRPRSSLSETPRDCKFRVCELAKTCWRIILLVTDEIGVLSVDSVPNKHEYETFFLPLSWHAIREDSSRLKPGEKPEGTAFDHLASSVYKLRKWFPSTVLSHWTISRSHAIRCQRNIYLHVYFLAAYNNNHNNYLIKLVSIYLSRRVVSTMIPVTL
jgi:hypothetical protein